MDLSELQRLEVQADQRPRLSQALRAGARLRPQIRGGLFDGHGTCALGAIYEGFGFNIRTNPCALPGQLDALLGELEKANCALVAVYGLGIIALNDYARWTRERIADALEKVGF